MTPYALWQEAPQRPVVSGRCAAAEIEEHRRVADQPAAGKNLFGPSMNVNAVRNRAQITRPFLEAGKIATEAEPVDDPNDGAVEALSRRTFLGLQMGVLKLDGQTLGGPYISDMPLSGLAW